MIQNIHSKQNAPKVLLFLFVWLLAACGGEVASPPTLIATAPPVQTFTPLPTNTATPLPSLTPLPTTAVPTATPVLQYPTETPPPSATPPATATSMALGALTVIGTSVAERPLTAYQFKNGSNQVVIVGGMHGGYEWNSSALAVKAIDYFTDNPDAIPDSVTLHIIPVVNPDGLALVNEMVETLEAVTNIAEIPLEETLPGRVNANEVDLNRNWDCEWRQSAYWRDQWVSGGSEPFSEPETQVLRDFLLQTSPNVVVFLHSAADGVFASGCGATYEPAVKAAGIYGLAAGYPVHEKFDAYPVTGDAGDWLSTQGIAAFTVELENHTDLDLTKNLAGMRALLEANR
ncbi:MAG: hypothetical protein IAF02_08350 [Anaerolineae bacterium]|nr:hypothetical protein [Anaerolineae bacterium]